MAKAEIKKGSYWERLSDTQKLKKAKRDKNNVLKRKTSHGTATWAGR